MIGSAEENEGVGDEFSRVLTGDELLTLPSEDLIL